MNIGRKQYFPLLSRVCHSGLNLSFGPVETLDTGVLCMA
jgi:hypothetical protein